MAKNVKAWYTSKTIWFNLISALVALAVSLQAFPLPEWALGVVALVISTGNFALRFVTDKAIK